MKSNEILLLTPILHKQKFQADIPVCFFEGTHFVLIVWMPDKTIRA